MKSVQKRSRTDFFFILNSILFYCLILPFLFNICLYINLEKLQFYNILAFHNKEKVVWVYCYKQPLSVAQENLAEAVPVEKTLSIFELLTSGGLAGNIIMASLFLMFFVALYLYFERLMAINAASKSTLTSWDKEKTSRMVGLTTQNSMCPFKISCCQINWERISRIGKPLRISIRQLKTLANWNL
jgi:hypothetical protein